MSHIFIAYNRVDSAFAQQLRQNLEQTGFSVWVDDRIDFGVDWWQAISEAIERSDALIVLMSSRASASRWVEREILYAENLDKPIFPVLIEGEIWSRLADIQVIDARQGPTLDVTAQLAQAIRAFASVAPERAHPVAAFPQQKTFARYVVGRLQFAVISLFIMIVIIVGLVALTASLDSGGGGQNVESQATPTASQLAHTLAAVPTQTQTPSVTREYTDIPVTLLPGSPEPTLLGAATKLPPTLVSVLASPVSVAQQVDATVAAFKLTEQSVLSPAEAAELAGLIIDNTDTRARTQTLLLTLNIVFTLLAVSILIMTFFISRGVWMRRPQRAHPAHPAHPAAEKAADVLASKHQVFISSSDRDREWVEALVNQLDREGFEIWWYAKDALGKPFGDEIVRAIFTTKVFAVIISPDSMGSKHVEEEIRIADRYDKPIVNILYRHTEKRLYGLAKGSEIDFTDSTEGDMSYEEKQQAAMGYLLDAIDYHLGLQTTDKTEPGSSDESTPM